MELILQLMIGGLIRLENDNLYLMKKARSFVMKITICTKLPMLWHWDIHYHCSIKI